MKALNRIDWNKVAKYLEEEEGHAIRDRANSAFPHDIEIRREMNTRSSIALMLAEAIRNGLS